MYEVSDLLTVLSSVSRIILEADPNAVVQKVAIRNDDIPLGEQTVAQVNYK